MGLGLLDRFKIVISPKKSRERPQVPSAAESSGLVSGDQQALTKAGFAAQPIEARRLIPP